MDINKPLPKPKRCVDDINQFLRNVRSTQKEAVENWYNAPSSNDDKWAALPSVSF
jgi:hypothetical protein